MAIRISKAYRGAKHIGWKKTLAGREWFLGYGTSAADETKAIKLAEVLEAKWKLLKAGGQTELTATDFEDAKALVAGQPRLMVARHSPDDLVRQAAESHGPVQTSIPVNASAISVAAAQGTPVRWLHASVDEFVTMKRRSLKPGRCGRKQSNN